MATEAYGDYRQRLREPLVLLRLALDTSDIVMAAGCAKGSVILAAAAMERYMNDAVHKMCSGTVVENWPALSDGHKRYLARQMARRLADTAVPIAEGDDLPEERKLAALQRIVADCSAALTNPSSWNYHVEFGLFRHGKGAADRITALLRQFSLTNRDPYEEIDEIGWDRSTFLRGLVQLIDARHAAAHALPATDAPGPKDAQAWIVLSFWLVRRIDRFIEREIAAT